MTKALVASMLAAAAFLSGSAAFAAKPQTAKAHAAKATKTVKTTTVKKTK